MRKLYKRFFALFLALAMVLTMVPIVFAESQDGLSVNIVTDKESYQVGDEAAVTVAAKNTGTKVISNIEVEIELPQGIKFKEGYSNIVKFDKLEPGQEEKVEVKGEVKKETPADTGDTAPTMLLMLLAAASAATAVIFMKKKNRNAVGICMGVLILSLAGLAVPAIASAAVTNAGFTLEKAVKVDGKDSVIKAKVSYQYEGEDETTAPDNTGNNNTGDNNTSTGITAKHISVHDPSIIKDGDTYYIFGTHRGWAKSNDLITWTTFTNNLNNDAECNNIFKDAAAWAALGSSNYEVAGNLWAPDVIYNKDMKKWCMYMSVNGDNWYSSIVLLTADSLDGDWTYEGPVVYSGFVNNPSAANLAKTDFTKVTKETTIPERYMEKSPNGQVLYSMNAIDPCVFYDEDGTLWMSYGSWFGGIYMLKLDPSTGLRDYNHTYETVSNESDIYQGIKLAGGTNVSGEASYIQYIDGYYYLFMTYGGLTADGGYNMRVFRSENVTGPYVDALGHDARRGSNTNAGSVNGFTGVRLMSYYKWSHMDSGYCAQGHNSALVDDNGKIYVIYHTRFNNRNEEHEVRVHQLFQTEDGWLIAAPYEYTGETLPEAGYEAEKVVGTYEVLIHNGTDFEAKECVTGQMLTLSEDGKVSGVMTGSWVQKAGTPYVTITLDGVEYNGVFIEQTKEGTSETVMCLTLLGKSNELAVWGSKLDTNDEQMLKDDMEKFTLPSSAISDLTLETTGFYGSSITYESSNPAVLANNGKVVRGEENQTVTMKVTFTKGEASAVKSYPITIIGTGSAEDGRILVAEYYTDNAFDLSKDGVTVPNPYNKTITAGLEIYKGVSIEFDVEGSGSVNSNILSFNNDVNVLGNLLYFTGGSYLGYNAVGGYFDANRKVEDGTLYHDYINGKAHIRIDITNSGFEVYVNNGTTPAYSNKTLPAEALGISEGFQGYSVVLPWLNTNAMQLSFGTGNWWADDKFNGTIKNVKLYANETENTINEWQSTGYALSNISYDDGMVVFNRHGQSGARGLYTTFKDAYKLADSHRVEFDFLMSANHSGSGSSNNEIVITGKGASYKANGTTTTDSNYILKLSTSSSGTVSTTYNVNDTNQTVEIPSNEWVHLSVITDAQGDVKAVLTYKDKSSATVNTHVNGSSQLDGISFLIGRASNAGIGNISVEADNTDVPGNTGGGDEDTAPTVTAEVTGIAYPDKASDITVTFTGDKELSDKYPVKINGTAVKADSKVDMMKVKSVTYSGKTCTVELTMDAVNGWHSVNGSYDVALMNGSAALAQKNVSYELSMSQDTEYKMIEKTAENQYTSGYYKVEGTKLYVMTIIKSDKIHCDGILSYGWSNGISSEVCVTIDGKKYSVGSHVYNNQFANPISWNADKTLIDSPNVVRSYMALGTFDNDEDIDKGCVLLNVVDLADINLAEGDIAGKTVTFSGFIGPNDHETNGDGTRFVGIDEKVTYILK